MLQDGLGGAGVRRHQSGCDAKLQGIILLSQTANLHLCVRHCAMFQSLFFEERKPSTEAMARLDDGDDEWIRFSPL